MKFSIYQESRRGGRKSNQDRLAYSYSRDALILVLADGMGGHLHGEVAAQIAVQFVTEAFEREAKSKLPDPFLFLQKSITNAHHAIIDYAETRKLEETPRTTCVACIVQDSVAYWAHVGDSRLYLVRNGHVHVQTKDHSRVQMLVDAGRIREEAVAVHPERNKIYNCLGSHALPQVDISRKTVLHEGDTLLLCSDGLWGPLNSRIIGAALLNGEIMKAVPNLMTQAEARAGKDSDNISAVAITWLESYPEAPLPGDVSTQTLELGQFTTQLEDFGRTQPDIGRGGDLSDEEIERAIAEIRTALRKHTGKPPP
jgi:serine/threonine protein phosphatase PrpC